MHPKGTVQLGDRPEERRAPDREAPEHVAPPEEGADQASDGRRRDDGQRPKRAEDCHRARPFVDVD